MKALIWVLTFFVGAALNTLLGMATGIKAGAVLLYLLEFYIARKLCEKWDEHKNGKEAAAGTSPEIAETPDIETAVLNDAPISSPEPTTEKPAKFCAYCGSELIAGSKFCSSCGAPATEKADT